MIPTPAVNEICEINLILGEIMPWSEFKKLTTIKEENGYDIALPLFRKALKELTGEEDYRKVDASKLKTHPESFFSMMRKKIKFS